MYKPTRSYYTIEEHQRRVRMDLSRTSILLMSHDKPKKSKKPFESNGDITKMRWKIMA